MEMTVSLDMAPNGAFHSREEWGHAAFFILLVVVLLL
jgi:hypothetical protein